MVIKKGNNVFFDEAILHGYSPQVRRTADGGLEIYDIQIDDIDTPNFAIVFTREDVEKILNFLEVQKSIP